ncbi:Mis12-domain-containing protein [Lepidopterella palustris CBS 459.81]|uniref:Mis12-domain-containing protein n=1 Tax=Lepidopterella palustris CBS 459.81 TaxID=1314670 RepID=A0A8E2JGD9_9PEZI|nr:Mis12-domain-containing protein [Lepidopterella palustris CBS 459.81]
MANPKQIENLLLTEHFRFTPITLIDDVINAVNERAYHASDAIESSLMGADPTILGFGSRAETEGRIPETDEEGKPVFPEARLEIEEGVHQLETLLENTIDKNFDKFEIYTLRNVLTVPEELVPWVRLEHYDNLTLPSPNTPTPTPESLQLLRRKLQETQKLHSALLAEKTRNEVLLSRLRALLSPAPSTTSQTARASKTEHSSPTRSETRDASNGAGAFAFLSHGPAPQTLGIQPLPSIAATPSISTPTPSSDPITTHTTFTLAQLPALRAQIAALRPYLATTSLPTHSAAAGTDEAAEGARERREYVESQTRRVLERRGVDVRNGTAVEGRRVAAEEVKALEEVVKVMSRGKGAKQDQESDEGDRDKMDTGD